MSNNTILIQEEKLKYGSSPCRMCANYPSPFLMYCRAYMKVPSQVRNELLDIGIADCPNFIEIDKLTF